MYVNYIRPGLERVDDSMLVDTTTTTMLSESVNKTSIESDSVSLTSQTSSLDTVTAGTDTMNQIPTETVVPSNTASLDSDNIHKVNSDSILTSSTQNIREEEDKLKVDIIATDRSVSEVDGCQQQDEIKNELLIDTSTDSPNHNNMEGEKERGVAFQDQQLLAEVFTSDISGGDNKDSSEEMREYERVEEVEKEISDVKSGNYNVELSSSDQLTLLIQSSESNLARIRYMEMSVYTYI